MTATAHGAPGAGVTGPTSGSGPYQLDVNPDGLTAAAQHLAVLADHLTQRGTQITRTPTEIPTTSWTGAARTAICTEMTALGGQVARFAEHFHTAATTLTELATACRQAQTERTDLNRRWLAAQDTYEADLKTLRTRQDQHTATLDPTMDPTARKLTMQDLSDSYAQARSDAGQARDTTVRRLDGDYQHLVDGLHAKFRQASQALAAATMVAVPDSTVTGFVTGGGTGMMPGWCTKDGGIFPPDLHAETALEGDLPLLYQRDVAVDAATVTAYLQNWKQHPGPIDPLIADLLSRRMSDPAFAGRVIQALGQETVTQVVNRLHLPVDWSHLLDNPALLAASVSDWPPGNPPYWYQVAETLPANATARQRAEAAANWFAGLTPAQQAWFVLNTPEMVGNLDGIPFAARDQANRVRLAQAHAGLAKDLPFAPPGQDPLTPGVLTPGNVHLDDTTWEKIHTIQRLEEVLAQPDRHLITFDLSTLHPLAAVAVGDLDTAHNVGVFTPGFTTTVASSITGYDRQMAAMQRLARQEAMKAGLPPSTAMVTWIGYQAPQWDEVLDPGRSVVNDEAAKVGGKALNSFYTGIGAARMDDPHLTALGHSYGSLTTSPALQGGGTGVDDVILFGSPGLDTNDVTDLHVPAGPTFVLEADGDDVAHSGAFGTDPNTLDGATSLSTQAADTPAGPKKENTGHSDYLNGDTTSQYNMACVIAGLPDKAVPGLHTAVLDSLPN